MNSNYTIKNVDYEGCPAEIATVISKGKMIECYISNGPKIIKNTCNIRSIMGYARKYPYPFLSYDGSSWKTAVPFEKRQIFVKEPVEIMKQLIANGYHVDDIGLWYCSEGHDFRPEMWQYCGLQPPSEFIWEASWIKKRRVE